MSILSEILRVITRKPPASLDFNIIHSIENHILQGDLDGGLTTNDQYMSELSQDNTFGMEFLKLLKARFFVEQQKLDDAFELINNVQNELNHPVINSIKPIETGNIHRVKGEFKEALEFFKESENEIERIGLIYPIYYKQNKARLYNLQAKIFNRSGKFEEAMKKLQVTLDLYEELGYQDHMAGPFNDLGISYASRGDSNNGLHYMNQSLQLYQKLGNESQALKLLNNIGLFNYNLSKLDDALKYYKEALELSNKLNAKRFQGHILLNMGLIYQDTAEIEKSMEHYDMALPIFEEMKNQPFVASVKLNKANLHQFTGDLDKAIKLYKECQQIWEELDSKQNLAKLYNSMASVYDEKGLSSKALSLVKQSVEISEEIGDYNYLANPLQLVIEILVKTGKTDEAQEYLNKFEQYLDKMEGKNGSQLFKLAKAEVLLTSDRVVKQAEAQTLLTELAEDEDIAVQYAVTAYSKLAELLLQELQISASEEALKEFKELIAKLTELTDKAAGDSSITPTKVSVLMLRSKLALIDLEIEESQQLLNEAYDLAKSNGLRQLAKEVDSERDHAKNQMMKYKQMVDTNASLYERLQESQIENYLKRAEGILKK